MPPRPLLAVVAALAAALLAIATLYLSAIATQAWLGPFH